MPQRDLTLMPFHQADLGTDTFDQELDESKRDAVCPRSWPKSTPRSSASTRRPEKFGVCEDGREIPFERLDIIPWATCD
jgi:RNA polymerase-binding transcription factor DksA